MVGYYFKTVTQVEIRRSFHKLPKILLGHDTRKCHAETSRNFIRVPHTLIGAPSVKHDVSKNTVTCTVKIKTKFKITVHG